MRKGRERESKRDVIGEKVNISGGESDLCGVEEERMSGFVERRQSTF